MTLMDESATKLVTQLVTKHTRKGHRKPESTCRCDAVSFPHRLGSVPGCYGGLVCHHGLPMYGHPDFEERCRECDREDYGDHLDHLWRDEGWYR